MTAFSIRILICILLTGITLYAHIHKQNELTELRLVLPGVDKEVKRLKRENLKLKYEIDRLENPIRLMELAHKPEFSHLKYPYEKDVIVVSKEEE